MDRVLENVSVILVAHDGFLICQVVQWAADGDHQSEYSVGNYREIAFICPRGSGGAHRRSHCAGELCRVVASRRCDQWSP